MKKIIIILLFSIGAGSLLAQTTTEKVDKKTVGRLMDWVTIFTMYSDVELSDKVDLGAFGEATDVASAMLTNPELSVKIAEFKDATFVNIYPKGLTNSEEWIFKKLNDVSNAQYDVLNAPYITLDVLFTSVNQNTGYQVSVSLKGSSQITQNLSTATSTINSALAGKTFAKPRDAKEVVNQAIFSGLDQLKTLLGSTFAPAIMILYGEKDFQNDQTIEAWQRAGQTIELIVTDKNRTPLNGTITWTNAQGSGNKATYPIDVVGTNKVTVKAGANQMNLNVKVKEFEVDVRELIKKLLIEVLTERKKKAIEELAVLRTDSTANANSIASLIAKLESDNFPMENNGTSLTPMFSEPIKLTDTTEFAKSDDRVKSFTALRKRKKILNTILSKLDVVALAELLVEKPDQLKVLVEDLVKNSGELITQLIINQPGKEEDGARSIVMDYLNKNMERLAGTGSMHSETPTALPIAQSATTTSAKNFDPATYLYISSHAQFNGRDKFVQQLSDSLNKWKNLYVFINYSQDVSTGEYLQRVAGVRPKGLPTGAKYKVYTLVNIPGSVKEQLFSAGATSTASSSTKAILDDLVGSKESGIDPEIIAYAIQRAKSLSATYGGSIYGLLYCKKCASSQDRLDSKSFSDRSFLVAKSENKCLLFFDENVSRLSSPMTDEINFVVEGRFNLNGEVLFGISNKNGNPLEKYFDCTDYLKQTLRGWNHCEQEPSKSVMDILFNDLDACTKDRVPRISQVLSVPPPLDSKIRVVFQSPTGNQTFQSASLKNSDAANFDITVDPSNKIILKINRDYLKLLQQKNPTLFDPSVWDELEKALQELLNNAAVNLCEAGSGPDCVAEQLNLLQVINLNLQSLASNNTIEPAMWKGGGARDILPSYAQWNPPAGGVVDGLVDEAAGIVILVKTIGEIAVDENKQDQIAKIFTAEGMKRLGQSILDDIENTISDPERRPYAITKAGVTIVFLFYSITSQAGKSLDNVLNKAEDLAKKIDKAPTLQRYMEGLVKAKDVAKIDRLSKLIDDLGAENLEKILAKADNSVDNLLGDLADSEDLIKAFKASPDLVDSWKALDKIGVDDVIRKNPDYLKNIGDYAKRSGKNVDEVADLAKNNENGIEQFLDELEDTPASGHWDKNPFQRGKDIEDDLGQNLPETFKTIDKYDDLTGEATSIKSLDLDAKTYQDASKLRSRLNKYLNDLDAFTEASQGARTVGDDLNPVNSKTLELAIPRAATGSQLEVINELISNGAARGIDIEIIILP